MSNLDIYTQTLIQMQNQLQIMFNQVNAILQAYGIKLYLYKIRTKSEACETCVEYIWVFEFKDRKVYENFVNALKAQAQGESK
jgi:hypothetical protein